MTSDVSTTTSGSPGRKVVSVPSGLAGERVDAAIARMFGLSRTKAADLVGAGEVTLDGVQPAKSDRVEEGALLEVIIPGPDATATVRPEVVEGLRIVYDDDAFVVVDKPVGVAAHRPSSVTWPAPGSRSRRPGCRSARASCNGSTSARRA